MDSKTKAWEGTDKTVKVKAGSCYESSSDSYSPLTKKSPLWPLNEAKKDIKGSRLKKV